MLQTFTGLRCVLVYRELMAVLARKNMVVRYGQVGPGIAWTFDITLWTCLARDSRV